MRFKASSAALFLCFNILFFLLATNPATNQAPDGQSSPAPKPGKTCSEKPENNAQYFCKV